MRYGGISYSFFKSISIDWSCHIGPSRTSNCFDLNYPEDALYILYQKDGQSNIFLDSIEAQRSDSYKFQCSKFTNISFKCLNYHTPFKFYKFIETYITPKFANSSIKYTSYNIPNMVHGTKNTSPTTVQGNFLAAS